MIDLLFSYNFQSPFASALARKKAQIAKKQARKRAIPPSRGRKRLGGSWTMLEEFQQTWSEGNRLSRSKVTDK